MGLDSSVGLSVGTAEGEGLGSSDMEAAGSMGESSPTTYRGEAGCWLGVTLERLGMESAPSLA